MSQLKELKKIFSNISLEIALGFEIEFYLYRKDKSYDEEIGQKFIKALSQHSLPNSLKYNIIEESGFGQFEIVTNFSRNLDKILNSVIQIQDLLKNIAKDQNLILDDSIMPSLYDASNSTHINIHLETHLYQEIKSRMFDVEYNFDKDTPLTHYLDTILNNHDFIIDSFLKEKGWTIYDEYIDSNANISLYNLPNQALLNSIGGLLAIFPNYIRNSISQLDMEKFQELDKKFAPQTGQIVGWGVNNRTTMIRVPRKKMTSNRIELRIPSAQHHIEDLLEAVLMSILYGLNFGIYPVPSIFGNGYDERYSLSPYFAKHFCVL